MKKKMIIGTLSAVFVLGGAFAVGASNNDDGTKVEVKQIIQKQSLAMMK